MTIFTPDTTAKITITSLDDGTQVMAQYNPKEISIAKVMNWQQHQKGNTDGLQYEFTGPAGRTTSIDLLFDGVEEAQSVAPQVTTLEKLATVRDPSSDDDDMRRPHHCVVVWGNVMIDGLGDSNFQCVITNLTVKYSMFSPGGSPLRATVTLQLQEAKRVTMADTSGGAAGGSSGSSGGDGGGGSGAAPAGGDDEGD